MIDHWYSDMVRDVVRSSKQDDFITRIEYELQLALHDLEGKSIATPDGQSDGLAFTAAALDVLARPAVYSVYDPEPPDWVRTGGLPGGTVLGEVSVIAMVSIEGYVEKSALADLDLFKFSVEILDSDVSNETALVATEVAMRLRFQYVFDQDGSYVLSDEFLEAVELAPHDPYAKFGPH
ncbi:hypothetical protein D1871_16010 [Nakamurella silvestris]|nr:hypothetical protein D1871_16010 [Nakamurella silvestris]